MQWNVSGSKLCEVPTTPPESESRVQVSIIAFVGERYYLLVNVGLSKYLGCIASEFVLEFVNEVKVSPEWTSLSLQTLSMCIASAPLS